MANSCRGSLTCFLTAESKRVAFTDKIAVWLAEGTQAVIDKASIILCKWAAGHINSRVIRQFQERLFVPNQL
jgi:hypothetical protein